VKVAFLQEMKAVETIGGPTIGLLVRYSCLGDVVDRWRMDYNHYCPHSSLGTWDLLSMRNCVKIYIIGRLSMAEVHSINTGFFWLDGGSMFGIVPRVLWEDKCRPDEKNRIKQAARVLLIINNERKILVDTGMGNWHDDKFIDRYDLERPDFDFDDALGGYGLAAKNITDVIITHLHFDHAGGLASKIGDEIKPIFPNASLWLQERQWHWAQHPSPKDRGSFMQTYLDILADHPKLNLLDGAADISPDVSVLVFDGHSPAMQTVVIKSDNGTCWFPSDLIPMAWHLRTAYGAAYDNNSVLVAEEKEQMLKQVQLEKWVIYFCHDPNLEKASQELIAEFTGKRTLDGLIPDFPNKSLEKNDKPIL